ncbi:conserved exported hypothetical protein [Rubrivivax sp. A210]|uniref:hypothetical protein n=1 Tax=Rubrivivax sp. A210 TaxID=2772301 RepID=UPI001917F630|nr:hypothetical protein [Rubrivivax sp. A210]CAD5370203.1 conserved exported hypothetical protein [Rubrivivax sp. A210]
MKPGRLWRQWWLVPALLGLLCAGPAPAAPEPDPAATRQALRALLASAQDGIPRGSGCDGDYGQRGRARVKDLLAVQLAYLYRGDNVITGGCAGNACELTIRHAAGEDVASATLRFEQRQGRARVGTLRCVITP